jgi:hypothetical protein
MPARRPVSSKVCSMFLPVITCPSGTWDAQRDPPVQFRVTAPTITAPVGKEGGVSLWRRASASAWYFKSKCGGIEFPTRRVRRYGQPRQTLYPDD